MTLNLILIIGWNSTWPWLALSLVFSAITFFFYKSWMSKLRHHEAESSSRALELEALLHHSRENEKKMVEDIKTKDDAFRKAIVQLNHDVRTPLNTITGMSSLMEETSLNSEQHKYLKSIQSSSDEVAHALDRARSLNGIVTTVREKRDDKETQPVSKEIIMTFSSEFAERYPLQILVAEDDPMNQQLALMLLKKLGYSPDLASDGKMVLDIVSEKNYDLIFMDVQMPVMDGLQATRMIRLCLTSQPVIVAMTANSLNGDKEACLEAGMNDYISKPVHREVLMEKLGQWSLRVMK